MPNRSAPLVIEASNPTHALARFAKPAESLSAIDPETAAALIATSSDLTLVVDNKGIVRDVAFANSALAKETYRDWIGRAWVDNVAADSRGKIEELIRESPTSEASRWRQVDYPGDQGSDVPIRHSVVRYGADRRLVVVGRDLRAMAAFVAMQRHGSGARRRACGGRDDRPGGGDAERR
jgi:hypothetical protein